ncbi:hypothetical protein ACFS5L_32740 [Streptomyces phyllanthi]|uniref:Uncharacterized protein n=1 Tax=Streptomyces phyllanthi TaxID=1803180 RepID=A0A5N8WBL7_9ACTN|nr:hypothetical protein [Streptomyces phyllanthi]MPY44861.1 hypothetical protein [Streptomyces phyllanthi]
MSSSRSQHPKTTARNTGKTWSASLRSPWTVACATVAVVLGPSAVTASALERANSAPLHRPAAPDHPPHHAAPLAAPEYAYLPRSTNRGQVTT